MLYYICTTLYQFIAFLKCTEYASKKGKKKFPITVACLSGKLTEWWSLIFSLSKYLYHVSILHRLVSYLGIYKDFCHNDFKLHKFIIVDYLAVLGTGTRYEVQHEWERGEETISQSHRNVMMYSTNNIVIVSVSLRMKKPK